MIFTELLDLLMNLIPTPIWDRLWRDARETGSGELAETTDTGIRVGLVAGLGLAVVAAWLLGVGR